MWNLYLKVSSLAPDDARTQGKAEAGFNSLMVLPCPISGIGRVCVVAKNTLQGKSTASLISSTHTVVRTTGMRPLGGHTVELEVFVLAISHLLLHRLGYYGVHVARFNRERSMASMMATNSLVSM